MDRHAGDDAGYDSDFYAWTIAQAAAVRRAGELRSTQDVDWENVAEEIEALGRNELDTVFSHLETIIEHLLKLAYSPALYPRADWETTVNKARANMRRKLTRTLRRKLRDEFHDAWKNGRKYAVVGLARDGVKPETLPADCPWTFDQLLDDDFQPPETHAELQAEPQA
jgi:hypothetical protein